MMALSINLIKKKTETNVDSNANSNKPNEEILIANEGEDETSQNNGTQNSNILKPKTAKRYQC